MVYLDFKIDETEVALLRQMQIWNEEASVIEVTCFMFETAFWIDGRCVFETGVNKTKQANSDYCYHRLPLLGFQSDFARVLMESEHNSEFRFFLDIGDLLVRRDCDLVTINGGYRGEGLSVRFDELKESVSAFGAKIAQFLRASVPELESHRSWVRWFPSS